MYLIGLSKSAGPCLEQCRITDICVVGFLSWLVQSIWSQIFSATTLFWVIWLVVSILDFAVEGAGEPCGGRAQQFMLGRWSTCRIAYLCQLHCQRSHFLVITVISYTTLQWRHNGRDSVSNHQPRDCLLNRLFRRRSKKTSKPRVTGLCSGHSLRTGEFPTQMASNAENISI